MGGLKKFMPVTFATMMVGTLAIAGIPPLSGFFSKDEILYRTFLGGPAETQASLLGPGAAVDGAADRVLHVPADVADVLRRVSRRRAGRRRRRPQRGSRPPCTARRIRAIAHAHGQAHRTEHEVSHGCGRRP